MMTLRLDTPIVVDDIWVAAISRTSIVPREMARTLFLTAEKKPVAILVLHGSKVQAFDVCGTPLSSQQLDEIDPTAVSRLKALRLVGR